MPTARHPLNNTSVPSSHKISVRVGCQSYASTVSPPILSPISYSFFQECLRNGVRNEWYGGVEESNSGYEFRALICCEARDDSADGGE